MLRKAIYLIALLVLYLIPPARSQVIDTVCTGSKGVEYQVPFTAGSTYAWILENGGAVQSGQGSSKISINWDTLPGLYKLQVVETTAGGCVGDTGTAYVMLADKIPIVISGPDTICQGDPAEFFVSGALGLVYWYDGSTGNQLTFTDTSTSIIYAYSRFGSCISDTAVKFLRVYKKPNADVVFNPIVWQKDKEITFRFIGDNSSKLDWYINGQLKDSGFLNPFLHVPLDSGEMDFTLIASNLAGCSDTFSIKAMVYDKFRVFLPNAFTPNRDGINDYFQMSSYGYVKARVLIFNRSHILLYEQQGLDFSWDGTYQGRDLEPGAYHYVLELEDVTGEIKLVKDIITLLR